MPYTMPLNLLRNTKATQAASEDKGIDDLYKKWQANPTKELNTKLINKLSPVINSALYTYGFKDDPLIRTEAELYTLDVLQRYDPKKGTSIETFITNELRRLPRLAAKQQFAIPIPEQAMLDFRHIQRAKNELTEKYGREPTVDELADYTKLSVKRIENLNKTYGLATRVQPLSEEFTGSETTKAMTANKVWLNAVYSDLDPINKKIFEWTLGWNGQPVKSKKEIAELLGISPAAVTQRSQIIAKKLAEGEQLEHF